MDIVIYLLVLFFSFLGMIIGIIISNLAVEEITHTSRHLKYLNILLVPLIFFISSYSINKIYSIIFTCVILIALIIFKDKYNDAWTYSCMGALLYVSTIGQKTLNVSVLIFIYGISIATIDASSYYKKKINGQVTHSEKIGLTKRVLRRYSYYLLVGILFYVIFSYVL